jgi:shikimate kinase
MPTTSEDPYLHRASAGPLSPDVQTRPAAHSAFGTGALPAVSRIRQVTRSYGRTVILVTGMSGTGKSTVLAELGRRGHRVVDTDDPGWIVDGETPYGVEPMWDIDRVREFLAAHRTGWLFVAGCVANQGVVYGHFDAVVLLSAPIDVILARVVDRANPFGSRPEERAKIADDLSKFEPRLRSGADHEIRTTAPVADVAAALERIAASPSVPTSESS